ncbi:2OG-Fe(II) oxygenase family protein [Streptomyces sp. NPDC002763]|uniref:2OG-Fe(II) oxygenase family protein n=1 Tax=Streptomyces sp. NPDC002763 TaxID=3154427 RepID=UPI00331C793B
MIIPTVDCARPDAEVRLPRALAGAGCALLLSPPIPAGTVQRIYDEWLAFFASDAKHRHTAGATRPDGYFPPPEQSEGGFAGDRKEFFHVYPGGSYPPSTPETALAYFAEAHTFARTLLDWIDRAEPEEDRARRATSLARMADGATATVLRVQHYLPAAPDEPAEASRAVAHTDLNLLTLMPAPSAPGLQVRHQGAWHDVIAPPGSLLVQVGEMLQLASAGRYRAALHQVVHPGGQAAREPRMSLPLFVHAADDVELAPGISAAAFRDRRLAEIRAMGWRIVAGGPRR